MPAGAPGLLHWAREALAGATGAVVMLAVVVTLGLLGFAPLGPALAAQGVTAALATAGIGGLVFALVLRRGMPVSGPSSATALIFAGLLAQLAGAAPARADPAAMLAPVLAMAGLAVLLSGVLQVAIALLRLGRLAQYVPQPVLAGFMNGVSLLILQAQLPVLLGLGRPDGLQPAVLALGLAAAGTTWAVAHWRPRWPAQLLGLVTGLVLYVALQALAPGLALGSQVGAPLPPQAPAAAAVALAAPVQAAMVVGLPQPGLPAQLLAPGMAAFVQQHAAVLLGTALMLALIGALESVLSALALERQLGQRAEPDATLLALGLSNIAAGLFGGLPGVLLRARAVATLQAGGRGTAAAVAGSLSFVLVAAALGPLVARLPLAVLAGIMLTVAVSLSDRWTRQLLEQWRRGERGAGRSADTLQNLAIVALVAVVTVWKGFALGVAAGCALALALFVRGMNHSLVRVGYSAAAAPSRRVHPPAQEAWLRAARAQIRVLELEGALFFGSAQRLVQAAEALPPAVRVLVLDLRGVSMIDASGGMALERLALRLADTGVPLLLAGVTPDNSHGRRLRAVGCFRGDTPDAADAPRADWFPDLDRATEAAELRLLDAAGLAAPDPRLPLQQSGLFHGLDAAQARVLAAHMPLRRLAPGELLFRQGDPADGLYVLTRGSITVLAGLVPGQALHRLASLPVGWMLGETAMLDGGGRSGSAQADGVVELHHLSVAALQQLAAAHPLLVARLYGNIALHLSQRLRRSTPVLHARAADG